MPSLFGYFTVVGSALFGLLLLVNSWMEPAVAPAAAAVPDKKITVRHDPRASVIERWRNEQAAKEAAMRAEPTPTPVPAVAAAPAPAVATAPAPAVAIAAAPEPVPAAIAPASTRPEPPQVSAPVALVTPSEPDTVKADLAKAQAAQAQKVRAIRAHKARIARVRAEKQRQQEAVRQQDPFFAPQPRSAYAGAPRPAFAPFGSW